MVNIRLANAEDLITVERLAREIWPVTYNGIVPPDHLNYMLNMIYNNAVLRDQLLNQHHVFLIVESDGKAVAFAAYSAVEPGISKLHKIYVHQDTQGLGIGKLLLDHIINDLQSKSFHTLRLNVNRYNKARFFYEKFGFAITKEEDVDLGNGVFMIDYVMEKKLM